MPDLALKQTHIIFVAGAVYKRGKILVGRRGLDESHEPGLWALPGGKVDRTKGGFKNILESTLKKEILEEVGVQIDHEKSRYIYSTTFIRSTGHHVVALLFLCPWKSGKPKALEDTMETAWVGKNDLNKFDWAHGTLESLRIAFNALAM